MISAHLPGIGKGESDLRFFCKSDRVQDSALPAKFSLDMYVYT